MSTIEIKQIHLSEDEIRKFVEADLKHGGELRLVGYVVPSTDRRLSASKGVMVIDIANGLLFNINNTTAKWLISTGNLSDAYVNKSGDIRPKLDDARLYPRYTAFGHLHSSQDQNKAIVLRHYQSTNVILAHRSGTSMLYVDNCEDIGPTASKVFIGDKQLIKTAGKICYLNGVMRFDKGSTPRYTFVHAAPKHNDSTNTFVWVDGANAIMAGL